MWGDVKLQAYAYLGDNERAAKAPKIHGDGD